MIDEILERIAAAGANGIKKTDLKKIFGKNLDDILEKLIEKDQIFVERKGIIYLIWTRKNYIAYLSQNDPKFKLILNMMCKNHTVAKVKDHDLGEAAIKISEQNITNEYPDFKIEFDKYLNESSTSIGWMSFSQIRKKICESKKLSKENFYSLATELVERHQGKYEVSSGGEEGIIMRGLVHGFVRNL